MSFIFTCNISTNSRSRMFYEMVTVGLNKPGFFMRSSSSAEDFQHLKLQVKAIYRSVVRGNVKHVHPKLGTAHLSLGE